MTNKLIVLVGPTGVGKTELSLKLAEDTDSEILSCDSMQIYRGMDIGTAKASLEEQSRIPHHMIDIKNPDEKYSVCDYVKDASGIISEVFARGMNVMLVGGTGLYADSLVKGIDFTETGTDESIRNELNDYAEENGSRALHDMLKSIDPESAEVIHPNNVKRVIRAIEYFRQSGEKISVHNARTKEKKSPYDYVYIGLTRDRDELYRRIDMRVDMMMEEGLLDEVMSLWANGCTEDMTSMQALGYKELLWYIKGKCTLNEAVSIIKRDSRRYAKRQLTWFGRNKDINWFNLSHTENVLAKIEEILDLR